MSRLRKTLPPLTALLPFEAAARLESFSKAADELHITQAAVSRQIRTFEEDLGVKLFIRRNRAVFLTEAGREMAHVVSTALMSISVSAEGLRASHRSNRVVLLCQLCEAFYWLMPRLSSFQAQHPEIEVHVLTSTRSIAQFQDHFDIALQTTGRSSGAHRPVFTAADEVFPVCSPSYVAAGTLLRLSELGQHRLLHYRSVPAEFMTWEDWMRAFGITLKGDLPGSLYDSYPLMLQAAVEGHGIALGWRRTAGKLVDEGALVQPCAESIPLPDAISVYTNNALDDRNEIRTLVEWLNQQLLGAPCPPGAGSTDDKPYAD